MKKVTILRSIAVIAVFCVAALSLFKSNDEQAGQVSTSQPTTSTNTDDSVGNVVQTSNSASSDSVSQPSSAKQSTGTKTSTSGNKVTTQYKDGQYQAVGSYRSPGGFDRIGVTLTVANDVVTDANVTNMAGSGTSRMYENAFIDSYRGYVVGQKLSDLNLDRVSGASLTTEGFNNALDQIRSQAQA